LRGPGIPFQALGQRREVAPVAGDHDQVTATPSQPVGATMPEEAPVIKAVSFDSVALTFVSLSADAIAP